MNKNGACQMNKTIICIILFFALFFSSCNKNSSSTINPEVLVTVTPPAKPQSGQATMTGQVLHQDGSPFAEVIVRLAEVERGIEGRGGAYILDIARSPAAITDGNGYFSIENIKAGEYVIVVGDIDITGIYEIIQESDGKAKVWNFPADQVTNIGTLQVSIVMPTPLPTPEPGEYPPPFAYPYP
jgi:hypothetical protein